jgi:hypothetical protein
MDFMFEDEVDEVGSDIEAFCPKCKADTTHVVISKYEDEIRRVQCNPCGDVHSFRKPRGEAEDDVPEPVAARKRALLKKVTFEEFFAKHGERDAKPYEFRECYRENQVVVHPKFGKGFISEIVSESKVEITFADARRILVHNRKDIPGSPLASEDDGSPSPPPTAAPTTSKAAAKKATTEKALAEKPAAKKPTAPEKAPADKPAPEKDKAAKAKAVPAKPQKPEHKPEQKPEHKPEHKAEHKPEHKVEKKAKPAPATHKAAPAAKAKIAAKTAHKPAPKKPEKPAKKHK